MSTVEAPASHLPLPMQNILSRLAANSTEAEQALVRKAYAYAAAAHAGQVRLSGEPYLSHPLAVAEVLAELGFDAHSVAAGLLHDTVEDTKVTLEEVDAEFGEQVADIVDGVTLEEKGAQIFDAILAVASGRKTKSEDLGYGRNEFVPWQIGAVM